MLSGGRRERGKEGVREIESYIIYPNRMTNMSNRKRGFRRTASFGSRMNPNARIFKTASMQ